MAAKNSVTSDGKPSRLLALPLELLQRITDNVSDETLTTFRLTCKAIEAATFDRFAKTFFEERYCCIYDMPRWTLLEDIASSRVCDRIRRVIFTTNVLAPARYEHLQLAPTKPEEKDGEGEDEHEEDQEEEALCHMISAQCDLANALVEAAGARNQMTAWPSKDVIERCLICLRNHTPRVRVAADLLEEYLYGSEDERTSAKANLIVAVVASGMKLIALKTTSRDIVQINETVESLGFNLDSCMHSVQRFSLKETDGFMDSRRLICGFLEVATELRGLKLRFCESIKPSPDMPASKLLSVSNISQLQVLDLEELSIEGADLITVLSCCRSTLVKVSMCCVFVLGKDNIWGEVFEMLASMPRLSKVRLLWPQQTLDDLSISGWDPDKLDSCTWDADDGRGQLTAGLKELLAVMPKVVN